MVIINLIQKWKLCGYDNLRLCLRIPLLLLLIISFVCSSINNNMYKKKNSNVNALYLQFLDDLVPTRRT